MSEPKTRQTRLYKLAALERAIVRLREKVIRPNDGISFYLSATESAVLLTAARIGLSELYRDPQHLDFEWPFP